MTKLRTAAAVLAAALLSSCSHFFIARDAFSSVKKVALVQYAINPGMLMGTISASDVRQRVADGNVAGFTGVFSAAGWQVVDAASAPAYQGGEEPLAGFVSAKGLRFFSGRDGAADATLDAATAQRLCQGLGVDAVVVVSERWGLDYYAMGFMGHALSGLALSMYDKSGNRVWGDVVRGTSEGGVATPGGIVSASGDDVVKVYGESFRAALERGLKATR